MFERAVGKSACRSPEVYNSQPLKIKREYLNSPLQFKPTLPYKLGRVGCLNLNIPPRLHHAGGFHAYGPIHQHAPVGYHPLGYCTASCKGPGNERNIEA